MGNLNTGFTRGMGKDCIPDPSCAGRIPKYDQNTMLHSTTPTKDSDPSCVATFEQINELHNKIEYNMNKSLFAYPIMTTGGISRLSTAAFPIFSSNKIYRIADTVTCVVDYMDDAYSYIRPININTYDNDMYKKSFSDFPPIKSMWMDTKNRSNLTFYAWVPREKQIMCGNITNNKDDSKFELNPDYDKFEYATSEYIFIKQGYYINTNDEYQPIVYRLDIHDTGITNGKGKVYVYTDSDPVCYDIDLNINNTFKDTDDTSDISLDTFYDNADIAINFQTSEIFVIYKNFIKVYEKKYYSDTNIEKYELNEDKSRYINWYELFSSTDIQLKEILGTFSCIIDNKLYVLHEMYYTPEGSFIKRKYNCIIAIDMNDMSISNTSIHTDSTLLNNTIKIDSININNVSYIYVVCISNIYIYTSDMKLVYTIEENNLGLFYTDAYNSPDQPNILHVALNNGELIKYKLDFYHGNTTLTQVVNGPIYKDDIYESTLTGSNDEVLYCYNIYSALVSINSILSWRPRSFSDYLTIKSQKWISDYVDISEEIPTKASIYMEIQPENDTEINLSMFIENK